MTDKIDRILEASEHPERFSDAELSALLGAADAQELYKLMSRTATALADSPVPDIDAEWERFSRKYRKRTFSGMFSRKTATAAIVVLASLAVVAATMGVRHALGSMTEQSDTVRISSPGPSAATVVQEPRAQIEHNEGGTTIFRQAILADVLATIAAHHNATVVYTNDSAKNLRLYFRWDHDLPLSEVIEQLNNFEQINIRLDALTLTVE